MLAIEIVKPFLHGRHIHITLFLDLAITILLPMLLRVCDVEQKGWSTCSKTQLRHGQKHPLEVSLAGLHYYEPDSIAVRLFAKFIVFS